MPTTRTHEPELHTADDVPLVEVQENAELIVDYFNNEATEPFIDLFADQVSQQTFIQEIQEAKPDNFDKLSEGEFPSFQNTPDLERYNELSIRTDEYGKSLGLTQRYFENASSDQVQRRIEEVVDGAAETRREAVFDVIMDSAYDGSGDLWFEVPDHGRYTFDDTHSHVFDTTTELVNSVDMPDVGGDGYNTQNHIEAAAEQLRHHGWTGPKVAVVSKNWKFRMKQELTEAADYHIPAADGLRETSVREMEFTPAGVGVVETPFLKGDEFILYDTSISPVKVYTDRELQLTRPQGGPVAQPGDILNGSATMSFGVANTNPLAMVEFGGVDIDYDAATTRY